MQFQPSTNRRSIIVPQSLCLLDKTQRLGRLLAVVEMVALAAHDLVGLVALARNQYDVTLVREHHRRAYGLAHGP